MNEFCQANVSWKIWVFFQKSIYVETFAIMWTWLAEKESSAVVDVDVCHSYGDYSQKEQMHSAVGVPWL
jgi:hypothetical protein